MPCRSRHFSGAEAADCTAKLSADWHSNTQEVVRTHKPFEVVAVADSQAGHHSLGTLAEAAAGSNLGPVAALSGDTPVNDTSAITYEKAAP